MPSFSAGRQVVAATQVVARASAVRSFACRRHGEVASRPKSSFVQTRLVGRDEFIL